MNSPQSPEARLVQVSLLPVWVEAQLRPPWLPVTPPVPVLWLQDLTGNPAEKKNESEQEEKRFIRQNTSGTSLFSE